MRPAMIASRPLSLIFRAVSSARDTGSAVKSAIDMSIHLHREALGTQPLTLAGRTGRRRHVVQQKFAVGVGRGLFHRLLEISQNPAETGFDMPGFLFRASAFRSCRPRRKAEVSDLLRKFLERSGQIESVSRSRNLQLVNQFCDAEPAPGRRQAAAWTNP